MTHKLHPLAGQNTPPMAVSTLTFTPGTALPLRARQIQFQTKYTRVLRLTERARRTERLTDGQQQYHQPRDGWGVSVYSAL